MVKENEGNLPIRRLAFMGGTAKQLQRFPASVRDVVAQALYNARYGTKHEKAKPLKGFGGAGVIEIVSRAADGTYRVVYTTVIAGHVIVLHAFQKKSTKGIATPKKEIDLVKSRLKQARKNFGE